MVNSNQLVYGGAVMIFVNPTGTTSTGALPSAFSTSAKLTINLSDREISSKDSGDWQEFAGNKFSWTMSTDALMSLSGVTGNTLSTKKVYNAFISKVPVYMSFASATGTAPSWTQATGKVKFSGQALITSMDFNAGDNTEGTYTFTSKGNGALAIG